MLTGTHPLLVFILLLKLVAVSVKVSPLPSPSLCCLHLARLLTPSLLRTAVTLTALASDMTRMEVAYVGPCPGVPLCHLHLGLLEENQGSLSGTVGKGTKDNEGRHLESWGFGV